MQALLFVFSHGSQNPSIIEYRKKRIRSKRKKLAFRCMRVFERYSLAGHICLCEDLYLKELTTIHKIRRFSGPRVHLLINNFSFRIAVKISIYNRRSHLIVGYGATGVYFLADAEDAVHYRGSIGRFFRSGNGTH